MIVDDNRDMRRMLCSIVSMSLGKPVELIECESGEEAVEQFDLHLPDHILMDVQLGAMNGFTAAEHIITKHPGASVIFVSSHNTSAYRVKALQLHAAGFVSKDHLSELDSLLQ